MITFRSKPHGEHLVVVCDPSDKADNCLVLIEDSLGSRIGFTGLELKSIIEQINKISEKSKNDNNQ